MYLPGLFYPYVVLTLVSVYKNKYQKSESVPVNENLYIRETSSSIKYKNNKN
jgi:hypothetical protein